MLKVICRVGHDNSGKDSIEPNKEGMLITHQAFHLTLNEVKKLLIPQRDNDILFIQNIEHLNQGLHPEIQREVIEQIKALGFKGQLILTTHSPYIVDEFEFEEVQVFHKGYSKFLSEHQGCEWAKDVLTTGEFWDAEGETWVTEQNEV